MNRYTYEINEPEDFENLLDFWKSRDIFPPIFVHWLNPEWGAAAEYWLETDWHRAKLTVHKNTPEEVNAVFGKQRRDAHHFIECHISHDESGHER